MRKRRYNFKNYPENKKMWVDTGNLFDFLANLDADYIFG
jgi:hypothetical protein